MADLIAGLGHRADHLATVPNVDLSRFKLGAEETKVLGAVGRVNQIETVLSSCGLSEPVAIAALLSLRAKGVIVPARVQKTPKAEATTAHLEEVDLEDGRRAEILELDEKLDRANHYQVLGLSPGASHDEVRKAFHEASLKFHPDRFYGKNLGSFRGRLDRIFRRLSEASRLLGDDAKREAYLKANPALAAAAKAAKAAAAPPEPARAPSGPVDEAREAERRARLSRHPYLARTAKANDLLTRAKAAMAKADYGLALTELHTASQVDDRNAEVKALLNEARKKNDLARGESEFKRGRELEEKGDAAGALGAYKTAANLTPGHALANFCVARLLHNQSGDLKETISFAQHAVVADPKNADAQLLLGQLLDDAGMKALSKKHLDEAARLNPAGKKQGKKLWPF